VARNDDRYYGDGCDYRCNPEAGWTQITEGNPGGYDVFEENCGAGDGDFWEFECDDGNTNDNDGCSSTCTLETGYECFDGNPDPANPDVCREICGDGLDYFNYWCDDGNLESGDGCDSLCMVERGWSCTGGDNLTPDTCTEICADGIDLHYYECDDGNSVDGDGCTSTCTIEAGWKCIDGDKDRADTCDEVCGDGLRILSTVGLCDDGNVWNGDGCSQNCDIETGWECAGGSSTSRDTCWETCGDGLNAGGNPCDDGNTADGDGCSSTCQIEIGYECSGGSIYQPDTCQEICGDGLDYSQWECDDGNVVDGDGCSSTCYIETGWYCWGGTTTSRS